MFCGHLSFQSGWDDFNLGMVQSWELSRRINTYYIIPTIEECGFEENRTNNCTTVGCWLTTKTQLDPKKTILTSKTPLGPKKMHVFFFFPSCWLPKKKKTRFHLIQDPKIRVRWPRWRTSGRNWKQMTHIFSTIFEGRDDLKKIKMTSYDIQTWHLNMFFSFFLM